MLLLVGDIHPNPETQTQKWVCDTCLKPIAKHQTSILCNYTKHWVHLKCSKLQQRTTTTYGTFQHRTQMNTTSPKELSQSPAT